MITVALLILAACIGVIVRGLLIIVDEHQRFRRRRSWL